MNFFVMGTTSLDVGKLLVVVGCAVGSVGANGGEAGHFWTVFWLSGSLEVTAGVFLVVFRFKKNNLLICIQRGGVAVIVVVIFCEWMFVGDIVACSDVLWCFFFWIFVEILAL